jgi:hypothetical protein
MREAADRDGAFWAALSRRIDRIVPCARTGEPAVRKTIVMAPLLWSDGRRRRPDELFMRQPIHAEALIGPVACIESWFGTAFGWLTSRLAVHCRCPTDQTNQK